MVPDEEREIIMSPAHIVTMMCLTKKEKFDVENPEVVVLRNGRYAYKVMCPWKGKNGKDLYAFKFCGHSDYMRTQSVSVKIPGG